MQTSGPAFADNQRIKPMHEDIYAAYEQLIKELIYAIEHEVLSDEAKKAAKHFIKAWNEGLVSIGRSYSP
jgi:hypothetical protein